MSGDPPCHLLPPELLFSIFAHLGAKDLVSCAVTCSRWSGPAVHTTWSTLWVPLGALLEAALPTQRWWEGDENKFTSTFPSLGVGKRTYTLELREGDAQETDWERLKALSAHVTRIRISGIVPLKLVSTILQNCTPFLPQVQELSIPYDEEFLWTLQIISHPSLRSVELRPPISYLPAMERELYVLKSIAETFPGLGKLILQEYFLCTEFRRIPSLQSLQTLRYVGELSYTEWNLLAAGCPTLETLTLHAWLSSKPSNGASVEQPHSHACFPSLKTLDMAGGSDAIFLETLLSMSAFPKLVKVSLPLQDTYLKSCIQVLSSCCPGAEDVSLGIYSDEDALGFCFDDDLKGLAELRALKALQLSISCFTAASHRFLSSIPRLLPERLPLLQRLSITFNGHGYRCARGPKGIFLKDLPSLLLKTPFLHFLEVPLNAFPYGFEDLNIPSALPAVAQVVLSPLLDPGRADDYEGLIQNLAALLPTASLSPKSKISFCYQQTDEEAEDEIARFRCNFRKAQEQPPSIFLPDPAPPGSFDPPQWGEGPPVWGFT